MKIQRAIVVGAVAVFGLLGLGGWVSPALAASATMKLFPSSGYAALGDEFAVDIMLNTDNTNTNQARAVMEFDPARLEVAKLEYGELYCEYPEDQYSVDNTEGRIMLTGFCQSGYNSGTEDGLLGRVTFKTRVEGIANVSFVHTGKNETWTSSVLTVASPPENILLTKPPGGIYTVISKTTRGGGSKLPGVGIFDNSWVIIGLSLLGGGVLVFVAVEVVSVIRHGKEGTR